MKLLLFSALCLAFACVVLSQPNNSTEDAARYQTDLIELEAHNERRIIGGNSVSNAEWRLTRPWEVQNVCDYGDGKGWIPCGCSSTIINKNYLITAGHCLNCPYTKKVGLRFADGHIDDQPWQEIHTSNWQFGSVESKLTCGLRNVIRGDVGLQYLARPIRFRYGVSAFPNILERRRHYDCSGIVAGWGATSQEQANFFAPVYSSQLYKLREKVYPNVQCQRKIAEWFATLDYVRGGHQNCVDPLDAGLLCASPKDLSKISYSLNPATFGDPIDPKGICNGDSGSPLIDPLTNSVLGFVSETVTTSLAQPCGYGMDIFTKFSDELKDWVRNELRVQRPNNWVCPNAA